MLHRYSSFAEKGKRTFDSRFKDNKTINRTFISRHSSLQILHLFRGSLRQQFERYCSLFLFVSITSPTLHSETVHWLKTLQLKHKCTSDLNDQYTQLWKLSSYNASQIDINSPLLCIVIVSFVKCQAGQQSLLSCWASRQRLMIISGALYPP